MRKYDLKKSSEVTKEIGGDENIEDKLVNMTIHVKKEGMNRRTYLNVNRTDSD